MSELPPEAGTTLTRLARQAIARRLGLADGSADEPQRPPDWLLADGATFVTLTIDGDLRGCIGSLQAYQPLGDDVAQNAQSAAFRDPRFPPLTRAEFNRVAIEVSVLAPPQPMTFTSEQDALDQLRPGVDGVILVAGGHRATFLPQVWEDLPDKRLFLAHLKRKAGLRPDFWDDSVRLDRYGVTAFHEGAE
ncbi:MAG: AmmeMemoRadiSam system protein A [Propionibacteriaceae bacterium]|jgi:AmmeMemoRadiSam system protein A|nr:AmmeMemoRadiSam system protein A [Propionibacteriaceae bacterium]